jgi:hypothetical protein
MYIKKILCSLMLFANVWQPLQAKQNTAVIDSVNAIALVRDTSLLAKPAIIKDTISPKILLLRDSLAEIAFTDSIKSGFGFAKFDLQSLLKNYQSNWTGTSTVQQGTLMLKGNIWILVIVGILMVLFALLKNIFAKQLLAIVQSFFSNRALINLNKEDNLFTSWPFLMLYIYFGFVMGMFVYLVAMYKLANNAISFNYFFTGTLLIITFYIFKIILLRLLGYLFKLQKIVKEYISILYLSYFNTALLLIPLVVSFALSPLKFGAIYINLAILLLAIIFTIQFIRMGINVMSNYQFPKVYLLLYFCTLEICPILILIKAIRF